jgi:hypothetical protein
VLGVERVASDVCDQLKEHRVSPIGLDLLRLADGLQDGEPGGVLG